MILDILQANMPKEIAEYLNKIGARIPSIKPGKATVEYLSKIQASTRFWGMFCCQGYGLIFLYLTLPFTYCISLILSRYLVHLPFHVSSCVSSLNWFFCEQLGGLLLSFLATGSSILDHYLRRINDSYAIGFTSVLIIVSLMILHLLISR